MEPCGCLDVISPDPTFVPRDLISEQPVRHRGGCRGSVCTLGGAAASVLRGHNLNILCCTEEAAEDLSQPLGGAAASDEKIHNHRFLYPPSLYAALEGK
ncbi:hypothetical protein NDU88_004968 [Pleurodeles waltl]|uniref:Uncharacterized protein n=1 Tax=Pleurodeles waltl TaxID=8319 RepID=A0AAV7V2Q2_PLEWA|nr:hypothetical protein NDU88_004968 [Pleurodeles waltl]